MQRDFWPRINPTHPLASGLVFAGLGGGASTTNCVDSSLYGNHGTLTNMEPATGWVWDAMLNRWVNTFAGSTKHVRLGDRPVLRLAVPFSFVMYLKLNSIANFGLLSKYNTSSQRAYRFDVSNAKLASTISTDGTAYSVLTQPSSAHTLSQNAWFHVGFRGTSDKYDWLFNGSCETVSSACPSPYQGTASVDIATSYNSGTNCLDGSVGDLLIWNRSICDAEVQLLADRSNVMLSGLILPPRRRLWGVGGGATPPAFKAVWLARQNKVIGGGVL